MKIIHCIVLYINTNPSKRVKFFNLYPVLFRLHFLNFMLTPPPSTSPLPSIYPRCLLVYSLIGYTAGLLFTTHHYEFQAFSNQNHNIFFLYLFSLCSHLCFFTEIVNVNLKALQRQTRPHFVLQSCKNSIKEQN